MERVDLGDLLKEAQEFHRHICAGQVPGVRMAMAWLDVIGIIDLKGVQKKDYGFLRNFIGVELSDADAGSI